MMEYDGICMYMYVHVRVFVYTYMHMEDVYIYTRIYLCKTYFQRYTYNDTHTETHVFILENTIVMICAHIWIQDYLLP